MLPNQRKIKLFWFRCNNFGDEASPYIIGKLTGKNIVYRNAIVNSWESFFLLCCNTIKDIVRHRKVKWYQFKIPFFSKVLLSVGSILSLSNKKNIVWGSGIAFRKDKIKDGIFYAVRGEHSRKRLEELGHASPPVCGDPAVLLPLLYNPSIEKKILIGFIPHKHDYDNVKKIIPMDKRITIISLELAVEKFIDEVKKCEYILSSSLHGLIVSHIYNIPALWVKYGDIGGDDIKFFDYFSSVKLREYNPIHIEKYQLDYLKCLFQNYWKEALVDENIFNEMRQKLINAAPFEVIRKYKDMVTNES